LNTTPPRVASQNQFHSTVEQFNFRIGSSYWEARRVARIARQIFDSKNLIRPTGDLLFKKLMTDSPEALLDLINRIVKPKTKYKCAEVKNPELLPESDGEKLARLDILVECEDGTKVDVEMQCGATESLEQRAMFYASRVYSSSLPEGDAYALLPRVIVIFLLEDAYFPQFEEGHHEFQMCRTWPLGRSGDTLSNDMPSLHFVELGKLRSSEAGEDPILQTWLGFMLPSSKEEWDTIASEDDMFSELKKKVEKFSADPDLAMQQRAIDEGRMSRQIELGGAFRRGKEEGFLEGRLEGRLQGREEAHAEARKALHAAIQRMLAKGMSKVEIAELQGLSLDELENVLGGN
jgi:predicted transposase/invertase (TIGR01784 family)